MSDGQVTLKHVTKSFDGSQFAVQDASVTIEQGEFFVLVGPSGCGKSTMLRMIAGLEELTAGEIHMHGRLSNDLSPSKRELSMVFQNYALYPHLTVEENILFGLKVRKVSKQEQRRRCDEAVDMLGMREYLKRKPRELSGGQRQRVALARAVVSQMPICLMDEPLSNLDAKLRAQMRTEIRQLQQELGITMIYVTHDQVEAMTMADRMMVLRQGEVQQVGRPLDLYNHPANDFVASFIGAPPMNLTTATVDNSGTLHVPGAPRPLVMDQPLPAEQEVQLGIRPEHLHLEPQEDSDWELPVHLQTVEVLGNETLLTMDAGGADWKAKIPGQWSLEAKRQAVLYLNSSHLHLFALDNGKNIGASLSAPVQEEVTL
ncbi:ABC transporter ATP-binding protein [Alkalicoccus chagannorensis]|uniref:ABC transporter ATP-binding protein n=1 Tax=Alkalicoccus chagannorensis TaxID=427072 RepID=UPI0004077194|nr:sn-glycerol-3-phosphate ABC transporter ATP-binding protein UgpC [Alkalicoccus chagannorensis]